MLHGGNDKKRIDMLLSLTKMSSEEMHKALHYYFVNGLAEAQIVSMTSVTKSNLSRDISKLNKINDIVEKIKELDYYKIGRLNRKSIRKK